MENNNLVWIQESKFILGQGYVTQPPVQVTREEAKRATQYQNVWYYTK